MTSIETQTRRAELARFVLRFAAVVFAIIVAVLLVIEVSRTSQTLDRLTELTEQNRATSERLVDFNEVTILAAACARQPDTDTLAEIRTCIEAGLAK